MRVAALQMNSGTEPGPNLDQLERLATDAAAQGATYLLTPEVSVVFAENRDGLKAVAGPWENNPSIARVGAIAKRLGRACGLEALCSFRCRAPNAMLKTPSGHSAGRSSDRSDGHDLPEWPAIRRAVAPRARRPRRPTPENHPPSQPRTIGAESLHDHFHRGRVDQPAGAADPDQRPPLAGFQPGRRCQLEA